MQLVSPSSAFDSFAFAPPENWERFPSEPQRPHIHTSDNIAHVGPITAALTPLLIAVGFGIRWLISWLGGRQDNRITQLEKRLSEVEERERIANNRLQVVTYHALAMSAKLRLSDPASPELASWERVLHEVFPLDAETPLEMLARALKVDA